jgi:hypothetical protein
VTANTELRDSALPDRDEAIAKSLVMPFDVVVLDVFLHRAAEVPLPKRNQSVKAFVFDRSHEALSIGVRIRRTRRGQDDADPRVPESMPHVIAPFPIPITDEDVRRASRTTVGNRQRPHDLVHEQRFGIRPGSENLYASRGHIDDEHRVDTMQSAERRAMVVTLIDEVQ